MSFGSALFQLEALVLLVRHRRAQSQHRAKQNKPTSFFLLFTVALPCNFVT